ncbi:hypothetical protein CEXT_283901 [Caerostris extrusa]|uniref:Uncharacterized protein n=1 Tax=Caerostris extrusa TaxID=172846 RepID=A0AAV4XIU2_CAEEX|nr:hypothetical protein CEXT_283901 [Caerostris extrusa]
MTGTSSTEWSLVHSDYLSVSIALSKKASGRWLQALQLKDSRHNRRDSPPFLRGIRVMWPWEGRGSIKKLSLRRFLDVNLGGKGRETHSAGSNAGSETDSRYWINNEQIMSPLSVLQKSFPGTFGAFREGWVALQGVTVHLRGGLTFCMRKNFGECLRTGSSI